MSMDKETRMKMAVTCASDDCMVIGAGSDRGLRFAAGSPKNCTLDSILRLYANLRICLDTVEAATLESVASATDRTVQSLREDLQRLIQEERSSTSNKREELHVRTRNVPGDRA